MSTPLSTRIVNANAVLYAGAESGVVAGFFTEDYRVHTGGGDLALGRDGVRRVLDRYRQAFSEIHVEVEILVEGPDRVAWQRTFQATHTGAFGGFPPARRQIAWRDMVTSRFEGGRIAEEWLVTDLAEQLLNARKRGAGTT
jgi:predicted ester cyclase